MIVKINVKSGNRNLFSMNADVDDLKFHNRSLAFNKDSEFYEFKGGFFATTQLQDPAIIRPLLTSYLFELSMSNASLELPVANFDFKDGEINITFNEYEIQLVKHILETKTNYNSYQ